MLIESDDENDNAGEQFVPEEQFYRTAIRTYLKTKHLGDHLRFKKSESWASCNVSDI